MQFAIVTVSDREIRDPKYRAQLKPLQKIHETAVWGEFDWDNAVWAAESSEDDLEVILDIISNQSFPKNREKLSHGQLRQLRDALIFEAHVREGRDIFVSNDEKAFVKQGRRAKLQNRFKTQILTRQQFLDYCKGPSKPSASKGT